MRNIFRIIALVLVCYVSFSIAALVAIVMCPIALAFDMPYAKRVLITMDKLMAAVLGWDGDNTVSAECGAARHGFCKTLCAFLDLLDPGHCKREAKR